MRVHSGSDVFWTAEPELNSRLAIDSPGDAAPVRRHAGDMRREATPAMVGSLRPGNRLLIDGSKGRYTSFEMNAIYSSDQLEAKLVRATKGRGYAVERGRQPPSAEYLAYLIQLDEQTGRAERPRRTVDQAMGLLAFPGKQDPSDGTIQDLLAERRMRKKAFLLDSDPCEYDWTPMSCSMCLATRRVRGILRASAFVSQLYGLSTPDPENGASPQTHSRQSHHDRHRTPNNAVARARAAIGR